MQNLFGPEKESIAQKLVECLGVTFPNDDARRAYFTQKLREKLKDPAFRKIEGFPIGDDEDILALSDPPYYTACRIRSSMTLLLTMPLNTHSRLRTVVSHSLLT